MSTSQAPAGHPALFLYPAQARFGQVVPKQKIYAHSGANTRLKNLFVAQVEQIVWQYKLAPETLNLPARPGVTEIQVFRVVLKGPELSVEDACTSADEAHGDRVIKGQCASARGLNRSPCCANTEKPVDRNGVAGVAQRAAIDDQVGGHVGGGSDAAVGASVGQDADLQHPATDGGDSRVTVGAAQAPGVGTGLGE